MQEDSGILLAGISHCKQLIFTAPMQGSLEALRFYVRWQRAPKDQHALAGGPLFPSVGMARTLQFWGPREWGLRMGRGFGLWKELKPFIHRKKEESHASGQLLASW